MDELVVGQRGSDREAKWRRINRYRDTASRRKPTTLERALRLLGCREKTAGMHREQVARLPTFRNLQRPRERVPLYRVQNCPGFWPKTQGRKKGNTSPSPKLIPQIRANLSLISVIFYIMYLRFYLNVAQVFFRFLFT